MKNDITKNFNHILRTEILPSVHKAVNALSYDCHGRFDTRYDFRELMDAKINELKNTVNTFADEELTVYKKMFHSPN